MKTEIKIGDTTAKVYENNVMCMVFNGENLELIAPKNIIDDPECATQVHLALAINHALGEEPELIQTILNKFDEYVMNKMPSETDVVQ
jgi:hypothetical protein